jgi:hypothetical protein
MRAKMNSRMRLARNMTECALVETIEPTTRDIASAGDSPEKLQRS